MTGVLTRRTEPGLDWSDDDSSRAARPSSAGRDPQRGLSLLSEIALTMVTLAAGFGFGRLFTDWDFLLPVLAAGSASHLAAITVRRLGLGAFAALLTSAVGAVAVVAWIVEPHTTAFGLPTGATWHAAITDLSEAWATFGEVKAPTPTTRGFVLGGVLGIWLVGAFSDAFAFRLRARFEAIAPSFTLFIFAAILAPVSIPGLRGGVSAGASYLGAVVVFVALTEAARRTGSTPWFGRRNRLGARSLLLRGLAFSAVAVALAATLGPHLPGATAPATLGWRDQQSGGGSRTTVSPLVDIRGRLVDLSNVEMFVVESETPAYWRLTSLETFDGTIWSSLSSYQPAGGNLASGIVTSGSQDTVTQTFAIGPLASIWLPAAYRPTGVDGLDGIRHDPESASLLTREETADGLVYQVQSAIPRFVAAELDAANPAVPGSVADNYLALPESFPEAIARTARDVVAASAGEDASAYAKALALQEWFRSEFTYDTDIEPGHGVDAIGEFLAARRGYCEQFSGTFAAMARSMGLPARVAVGFTPGTQDGEGRYHVAGRDAHAWPEVFMGQFGWVAFEPTPGRAIPGGDTYVGPTAASPTEEPSTSTTLPDGPLATPDPALDADPTGESGRDDPLSPPAGSEPSGRLGATITLILLVNAGYVAGLWGTRQWVRSRRRARAGTSTRRVLATWAEAEDVLSLAGISRLAAETPTELARRVEASGMDAAVVGPIQQLSHECSVAEFAPDGAADSAVTRSAKALASLERALKEQAGWQERIRWATDPRPVARGLANAWRQRSSRSRSHRDQSTAPDPLPTGGAPSRPSTRVG